jgi:hypothetical protein
MMGEHMPSLGLGISSHRRRPRCFAHQVIAAGLTLEASCAFGEGHNQVSWVGIHSKEQIASYSRETASLGDDFVLEFKKEKKKDGWTDEC